MADIDEQMVTGNGPLRNKNTELMEADKYLAGIQAGCDFLLKYCDMRKEARTGEVDAMGKASLTVPATHGQFV